MLKVIVRAELMDETVDVWIYGNHVITRKIKALVYMSIKLQRQTSGSIPTTVIGKVTAEVIMQGTRDEVDRQWRQEQVGSKATCKSTMKSMKNIS